MAELYDKLIEYSESGFCSMHMPGHKGKFGIGCRFDITEIDGFDNLSQPQEILDRLQKDWAEEYGAAEALISVNGSTGAILAAICGICSKGDKIIIARNCHKSVYNAAELFDLRCEYIFPQYDENGIALGLSEKEAKDVIEKNKDASLIVITSPTYEGNISKLRGICDIAHKYDIPVFVDSAHGAYLKRLGYTLPIAHGVDIVCVSLHKTLPALTQTALILFKKNGLYTESVKKMLNVFQTSSPSYVLMASIAQCLDYVKKSGSAFDEYKKNLFEMYSMLDLKKLKIIKTDDIGKVVIGTHKTDITGNELMCQLREKYKIELEMAYADYVVAMTSVCNDKKDFIRLSAALNEIDSTLKKIHRKDKILYPIPEKVCKETGEKIFVNIEESCGYICADYIWAYPPGVPIIAPMELIEKETVEYIKMLDSTSLYGVNDGKILVYKNVI